MREKLMLSQSAYPADIQRVLTEMEKLYKAAIRDSRFEAASGISSEQDEVIRTLNILALIGKNAVQNTEAEKLYFAYLTEQDEAKKAALKERYISALRGYGTEEKEKNSQLALWIGDFALSAASGGCSKDAKLRRNKEDFERERKRQLCFKSL